jgi:hypothetical protein
MLSSAYQGGLMDNETKKRVDCKHCLFLRKSQRLSLHKDYCQEAKKALYYVEKCPLKGKAVIKKQGKIIR